MNLDLAQHFFPTTILVVLFACNNVLTSSISCEEARLKCAYRTGCGRALQDYIVGCSSLHQGIQYCPETCQHALIALTSTMEGKQLMLCQCTDNFCRETKEQVEICRPQVLRATKNETIVTCSVAQRICSADVLCAKALEYYHINCRSMFEGKRCTSRCKNSINILRRQEKAAKLDTCQCNGREDYDCFTIKRNMERLCYHKKSSQTTHTILRENIETNEISTKGHSSQIRFNVPLYLLLLFSIKFSFSSFCVSF